MTAIRTEDLFNENRRAIFAHTDRMFAVLMAVQWLGGIAAALWISPKTWAGAASETHTHVWLAIFLGAAINVFPITLAILRPGSTSTRYIIATAQMLMSSLLIHLLGGRIETHFHVFGSFAFLSIYRDWRVFVPSTLVVLADHVLRGLFWPQSVYGVMTVETWRWLEHAGWVVFENTFLLIAIRRSVSEMWESAKRRAEIENLNDSLEREVGERRKAEDQLGVFNEKLQRSNRELQDFAYVASHDLQEPLRKVQTFADRLRTKYGDTLEGEGIDYLDRMQNAAARMRTLIVDLLSFSRVSSKEQPFEVVDLERVTKEVLSDLEVKMEETGATVEISDLPVIDADPMQMRQLMQNLIGNALKFQQKDTVPIINIRARLLGSDGNVAADRCQISVKDNGIGFDEKHTVKIFAVFQRLHGRVEYEGSGVGLAICRKIAERHNGSITAESAPGDGATFIITLPLRQLPVEIN